MGHWLSALSLAASTQTGWLCLKTSVSPSRASTSTIQRPAGNADSAQFFHSAYPDEFVTVPFGDLDAVEKSLSGGEVAAVLMETIPATYGFPIPSSEYLPGIKSLCEQHGTLYVADAFDHLRGLVTLAELANTPPDQRASTPIERVMRPAEQLETVTPDETTWTAFRKMAERNVNQLPVVAGGKLVGAVTRERLVHLVQAGVALRAA